MDFIVVERKKNNVFLTIYVINVDNLIELRNFIKESFDLSHKYSIYDMNGCFIEYY